MKPIQFLAVLSLALLSCTPAQWAGLETANTVVRGACGAILAADRPEDVLAALADAQRTITTQIARSAEQNSDPAEVAEIVARLGALQDAQRAHAEALAKLAGTIFPPPCPLACEPSPTCVLDAPGAPPAPAGAPCGPGRACDGAGLCCLESP